MEAQDPLDRPQDEPGAQAHQTAPDAGDPEPGPDAEQEAGQNTDSGDAVYAEPPRRRFLDALPMAKLQQILRSKWTPRFLIWSFVAIVLGIGAGLGAGRYIIWQGARFPDLDELKAYKPKLYTKIHDRNGVLLATISTEKRIVLDFGDIPSDFVHAMVAVEDENFFTHVGVSPFGILAAIKDNIIHGTMRGASTLTQQLVKNITKDSRSSYKRKLKEQFLAVQLEALFTKEELFAMYANEVPFGNNQFGIEAAAKYYFGKSVGALSLEECATLAGLPQAPSRFNPFRYPERARTKRDLVLERMYEENYITKDIYRKAIQTPLQLREKQDAAQGLAGHFTDKVRRHLFDTYGEENVRTSAWDVYTTLDIGFQRAAEEAVRFGLKEKDKSLGYRHWDCPSVFKLSGGDAEDILDSYFDPTWNRSFQPGIELRGLVTRVTPETLTVRIRDTKIKLTSANMAWVGKIPDLRKRFKVGDLPLFSLHDWKDATPPAAPTQEEIDKAAAEGRTLEQPKPVSAVHSFPYDLVLDQVPDIEAALIAIDPSSGDILAMVGGRDYTTSKFNRADQARRQVGSVIKPIVYGAALENGVTIADTIADEPTQFWDPSQLRKTDDGTLELAPQRRTDAGLVARPEPYEPHNYDATYDGRITLRRALSQSTNIVAVKLLNQVGYDHVIEYAEKLKLLDRANLLPYPSLALGAPEITLQDMTLTYGTFAREGIRYEPRLITEILDAKSFPIERNPKKGEQVISPQNAFLVADAMTDVIRGRKGTGALARRIGFRHIAGKTGTTNDYTDAWFIGFTRQLAVGVWVGRDANESIGRGATGSNTALPIWVRFMELIKSELKDQAFPVPEGVVAVPVDYYSGKKLTKDCGCDAGDTVTAYFLRGTEPTEICSPNERSFYQMPWYLQRKAYQVGQNRSIKPSLVEIDYASQVRALDYLRNRN